MVESVCELMSSLKRDQINFRDPFVLPIPSEKKYYLFGTVDRGVWGPEERCFRVYVSTDLENFEELDKAFVPPEGFWATMQFWAPEVHFYRGKYYMFASFRSEERLRGTQILVSEKPQGPYLPLSDGPVTPEGWWCLDGTFYVDEDNVPWIIFCHEWVQIEDGAVMAMPLTEDLTAAAGEPVCLFHASEVPWVTAIYPGRYVTDGPFLFVRNGKLQMLWSSFCGNKYALGIAESVSGKVTGPWRHRELPWNGWDGGHGMLFRSFEGKDLLVLHSPNSPSGTERPVFYPVDLD